MTLMDLLRLDLADFVAASICFSWRDARVVRSGAHLVRNAFAEAVARGEAGHRRNPYAGEAMKLFYEGRTDLALVGCGESAVLIGEVKPAGDIVRDTVREFWEEIDRLSALRKHRPDGAPERVTREA